MSDIAFIIATIGAVAWSLRGGFVQRACGILIGAICVVCWIAGLTVGTWQELHIAAVCDALAALACTYLWLRSGAVWPLTLMMCFMVQIIATLDYSASAFDRSAWVQYVRVTQWVYAAELLILSIGPYVKEWVDATVGFFRNLFWTPRLRYRRSGHLRPVTREKAR